MNIKRIALPAVIGTVLCLVATSVAQAQQAPAAKPAFYNTAKQKLLDGKQIFSFTQSKMDPAAYCRAVIHYDYTWFEMLNSTLNFADIAKMIATCPHTLATPMIRLPDAQESHIEGALDAGALGVIIPTDDKEDRAREAVKWARFPPRGSRTSGQGHAASIWGINGIDYRQTIDDNVLVVMMIVTPATAAKAFDIASVPGVDVVIVGNADLSRNSGFAQNDPRYQAMTTKIYDDTRRAGKIFGQTNPSYAAGDPLSKDSFFFRSGPSVDGWKVPAGDGPRNPNFPPLENNPTPAREVR